MKQPEPVEPNPYGLPPVLLLEDLALVLHTSVRTLRKHLQDGTFPLLPMTGPRCPLGIDKRYRWARKDVEHFLDGGYRSFDRRNVRIHRTA